MVRSRPSETRRCTLEDDIDDNALVTNREVFERVCQVAERMCPREKFFKAAELFALLS